MFYVIFYNRALCPISRCDHSFYVSYFVVELLILSSMIRKAVTFTYQPNAVT